VADQVALKGPVTGRATEVLTPEALEFVASLQREFGARRVELLRARDEREARLEAGETPGFLTATKSVRESEWRVAPVVSDLQDRRVEITGPTDRKMLINALNSGADVYMADFEDANTPSWQNMVEGQINLGDATLLSRRRRQSGGRDAFPVFGPPTASGSGNPRLALRRSRAGAHPAVKFAPAVQHRVALAKCAAPGSRSASPVQSI
jgi:hypothetical protein